MIRAGFHRIYALLDRFATYLLRQQAHKQVRLEMAGLMMAGATVELAGHNGRNGRDGRGNWRFAARGRGGCVDSALWFSDYRVLADRILHKGRWNT